VILYGPFEAYFPPAKGYGGCKVEVRECKFRAEEKSQMKKMVRPLVSKNESKKR